MQGAKLFSGKKGRHILYRSSGLMIAPLLILLFTFSTCRVNPPMNKPAAGPEKLALIKLPPGFKIDFFASGVKNVRAIAWGADNVLFGGSRSEGKVYAMVDKNGDKKADEIVTVGEDLHMPTGIAYKDGNLYVSEVSRVLVFKNIDRNFRNKPSFEVLPYTFPEEEHHGWKYLKFGPDGKLYVPVGAPCNICKRDDDPRFASIMRMNPDGSGAEIFASGIRNSVGFDWHPVSKTLYFTENGRDWMGDDIPPCELNHAPEKGMHFGFPYCHGGTLPDTEYGREKPCSDFTPPLQNLGPHVAPLGMTFYTGTAFPAEYRNGIFMAEHGSWNRTKPLGYRVSFVALDENGKSKGYTIFAEGWLEDNGSRWGRPADILMHPDGSLLVSDDFGDAVYRIYYQP